VLNDVQIPRIELKYKPTVYTVKARFATILLGANMMQKDSNRV